MRIRYFRIKSSNRLCQLFPWIAPEGKPYGDAYERVVIPLSEAEKRNCKSSTKCHIQIVRRDNLEEIKERGLVLV